MKLLFVFLLLHAKVHAATPKLPAGALKTPLVRQATTYSCGAAVMLSVLSYWQVYDGPESSLYSVLGTTEQNGTDSAKMQSYAASLGLESTLATGQTFQNLREKLQAGYSIILDFQAWAEVQAPDWRNRWEDGHYGVLVGMDQEYLYFMDPSSMGGHAYISLNEFMDRWHDYEIRDGKRVELYQLALYIKGKHPLPSFPAPLIRLD